MKERRSGYWALIKIVSVRRASLAPVVGLADGDHGWKYNGPVPKTHKRQRKIYHCILHIDTSDNYNSTLVLSLYREQELGYVSICTRQQLGSSPVRRNQMKGEETSKNVSGLGTKQ